MPSHPARLPRMRFLFVRSVVCLGLPSDSTSRWTPLPLASCSPCRASSGLSPPSHPQATTASGTASVMTLRAMPGAQKKTRTRRVFSPPRGVKRRACAAGGVRSGQRRGGRLWWVRERPCRADWKSRGLTSIDIVINEQVDVVQACPGNRHRDRPDPGKVFKPAVFHPRDA